MQQEKKFLMELKQHFRLNIYEVKIWTALLSRGIASAGELADISGVPRSRCYDVLETLEKKGFIIMKIGKPIKYLAVQPQVILERVKHNIKSEADEIASQIENIKETEEFKELELLHTTGVQHVDIDSISKSIVGRTAINRFIKDMVLSAGQKVDFVCAPQNTERCVKLLKNLLPNLSKKGINSRIFCQFDNSISRKLQNSEVIDYNSNTTFVSIDNKEMIFLVSNESAAPDYEVAIWIKSPFFVNAVNILFASGNSR
ncbi:MAG TPA: helix-turn-helix domain-containing protein [Candidatus Nanoarchaeia archaeon]|nr:helix-turn-helix domain-containing protein [Candidatus Nanoarchaeia archaeon]